MESKLKDLRQFFKNISETDFEEKSRELSLFKTSAQEAMMQCGNILKVLGSTPDPYKNSKDPSTGNTIEPMFDIEHKEPNRVSKLSHVVAIKARRERLDDAESIILDFVHESIGNKPSLVNFMVNELYLRCRNTTNWLGMELGRIRDLKTEDNGK